MEDIKEIIDTGNLATSGPGYGQIFWTILYILLFLIVNFTIN